MSVIDRLNEAVQVIERDTAPDPLMAAVGDWLRAEALTQETFEPLVSLLNLVVETKSGNKATLTLGRRDDGEIEMRASTNEHALAVAAEVLRCYVVTTPVRADRKRRDGGQA